MAKTPKDERTEQTEAIVCAIVKILANANRTEVTCIKETLRNISLDSSNSPTERLVARTLNAAAERAGWWR